jgi:hypothetical protein
MRPLAQTMRLIHTRQLHLRTLPTPQKLPERSTLHPLRRHKQHINQPRTQICSNLLHIIPLRGDGSPADPGGEVAELVFHEGDGWGDDEGERGGGGGEAGEDVGWELVEEGFSGACGER